MKRAITRLMINHVERRRKLANMAYVNNVIPIANIENMLPIKSMILRGRQWSLSKSVIFFGKELLKQTDILPSVDIVYSE